MDFDLKTFSQILQELIKINIPKESDIDFNRKHKKRAKKLIDVAFNENSIIPLGTNGYVFELGNETLEREFPHYHILEDAQVIYKRQKGTKTSRGSQAQVQDTGKRDYGKTKIVFGKGGSQNIYQEYRKNVRGSRSRLSKATKVIRSGKTITYINRESNFYANEHYHYLENVFNEKLPSMVGNYGLKMLRTQKSIADEYNEYMSSFFEELSWANEFDT